MNFFSFCRDLVGAAVLVLVAVLGLRLGRALVLRVRDAVAVVVRIGAAVLRPGSRPCPRARSGTCRPRRGCRHRRCPGSGQPSSSWKPSLSSGSFGHLSGVRDAVAVVVRIRAAVLVLEAVLVLGLVRALVLVVRDAVTVGVLGTLRRLDLLHAACGRTPCRSRAGSRSPR